MRRLRVYLAGPISKGDLCHNINQATEAFVTLAKAGLAPMCPHWSAYSKPCQWFTRWGEVKTLLCEATVAGNDQMTHEDWLGIDLEWVGVADALLRLPGESTGADKEVAEATRRGIPVFHSVAGVIRWAETAGRVTTDCH